MGQLELELNTISKIILLANSSLEVVKYLQDENTQDSKIIRYEKNFSYFFPFVSVNFYRITIIELCKLFNHNEFYSFKYLINKLHAKKELNGLLEKDKLKELNKLLKSEIDIINEMILIRNKHYAHQDENYSDYITIEVEKLERILQLSKKVFNYLYQNLYQKTFFFDFPLGKPLDSLENIFYRLEVYDSHFKNLEDSI